MNIKDLVFLNIIYMYGIFFRNNENELDIILNIFNIFTPLFLLTSLSFVLNNFYGYIILLDLSILYFQISVFIIFSYVVYTIIFYKKETLMFNHGL